MLITLKDVCLVDTSVVKVETIVQGTTNETTDAVAGDEAKQTQDMYKHYLTSLENNKRQRL